jgi:hypothetical protein
MFEDKLTRDQRIRLECFAQMKMKPRAVDPATGQMEIVSMETLLKEAAILEAFVKDGVQMSLADDVKVKLRRVA